MKRRRRAIAWAIGILTALLSLWWIFTFPCDRERLYAPIPFDAAYVSEHDDLAGHWRSAAGNPLVIQALADAGITQEEIDEVVADKGIISLVNALASKKTVIAYSPSFLAQGRPAWVISSWVGGTDRLFNWGLLNRALKDFEMQRLDRGRRTWVQRLDAEGPFSHFTFAVVEGLAVGCLSSEPSDLRYLLIQLDRGRKKGANTITRYAMDEPMDAADRVWVDLRRLDSEVLGLPQVQVGISDISYNSLHGSIRTAWPFPEPWEGKIRYDSGIEAASELLGRIPDAVALVPVPNLQRVLTMPVTSDAVRVVGSVLTEAAKEDSVAFLAAQGADFSIKVMQLPLPSLIAGVQLRNPTEGPALVSRLIDKINAQYKTTFIPRTEPLAGRTAIVLESTNPRQYSGFGPRQKPTFVIEKDWLIAASNMEILDKIFAPGRSDAPDWTPPRLPDDPCLAYSWLDLENAGVDLENALSIYALLLWPKTDPESNRTKQTIKDALSWLDAVRMLGSDCTLTLSSEGKASSEITLEITPKK